jgi:hypothetical protein
MTTLSGTLGTILAVATMLLGVGCSSSGDDAAETHAAETHASETHASETATMNTTESGETAGCVVTNGCGTFDQCSPGEGVVPDDPETPSIVAACTSYCMAIDGIGGCMVVLDACVNQCAADACAVCPGTLAPLIECRTQELDASTCICNGGAAADCPVPPACQAQQAALFQCEG